jgi:hypothetical protein
VIAGWDWEGRFTQGMIMVFSKDVLANILNDPRMFHKDIMKYNDDVALSKLAEPYSDKIDWKQHFCMLWGCQKDNYGVYILDEIKPRENEKWLFRICGTDNENKKRDSERKYDIVNWDNLLVYFNEYEIVSPSLPPTPYHHAITPRKHNECIHPIKQCFLWVIVSLLIYQSIAFVWMILPRRSKKKMV